MLEQSFNSSQFMVIACVFIYCHNLVQYNVKHFYYGGITIRKLPHHTTIEYRSQAPDYTTPPRVPLHWKPSRACKTKPNNSKQILHIAKF